MEPVRYLNALRRRWWVIVATVAVATTAAWITTSLAGSSAEDRPSTPSGRYWATTVMWNPGDPSLGNGSPFSNPATIAQIVTQPEVAAIAARRVEGGGGPLELLGSVQAFADDSTGFIYIKAISTDPDEAEAISTAFSEAIVVYLGQLRDLQLDQRADLLTQQIQRARALDLGQGVVQGLWQQRAQIALSRTVPISLATFSPARAAPEPTDGGTATLSRWLLILLASALGLVLGVVLALVMERFDTRIRTRRGAEEAFGVPVLAEVPTIPRGRRGSVVTSTDPLSRAADAFRLLSVTVAHPQAEPSVSPDGDGHGRPGGAAAHPASPKTILVASPEARDGKTTVAANLAAAYAEVGKRVLVLSCDLRRPAIHELFHVPDRPGLTELLGSMNGELDGPGRLDLGPFVEILPNGVAVLPSGAPPDRPGEVLGSPKMHRFVDRARDVVDVVVLDSAPLLVASDAAALAPEVDAVVLVAKAGRTQAEPAGRSADLLGRLGAPVVGVVLNDTKVPRRRRRRSYRPTRRARQDVRASGSRNGRTERTPKHAGNPGGRAARRRRG